MSNSGLYRRHMQAKLQEHENLFVNEDLDEDLDEDLEKPLVEKPKKKAGRPAKATVPEAW